MKKKLNYITVFFFFIAVQFLKAQVTFYDLNTIQKIEIYFSQSNWDYQLDTARYGADDYLIADWVKVNGIQFDSAGVKYKGNSSYDSTFAKNPLHIELDNIINQSYQGITDIKLGNGYADPSAIREVLAYDILKNYMDCPRSNFVQLYINGTYIGLYSNDESINKDFVSNHFYSSQGSFYKCNPVVLPAPNTKSNLKYISADSSNYFNFYELKSDFGWNELVQLCDTVTNMPSAIESSMDLDRVMWMLAFNSVLVNLDSYTGAFCQNYYLYRDNNARFNPVMWDLNMCFGGFPYVGSGNSSLAGLTVANMQQLSPTFHATDPYWPLINIVTNNATYKKQYIAHARTINNENFVSGNYLSSAVTLQTLVDTAVQSDVNAFFTYNQFQNGLNTNYTVGSYTVPGISNLMNARVSYLQTNVDFSYIPPSISFVAPSNPNPAVNSLVTITATVTNVNSNAVYLSYRTAQSDKFTRILMYDDGLHNDGASGDNVYGADIIVTTLATQYYIYAENNNAGMFSPERAEHDFYTLITQAAGPTPGQVVINEFLANNVNDSINESGNHADWIELFNNTTTTLSLFGLYLTDDFTNPAKFAFPYTALIPANGYMVLWADENNSTPSYLHCNFKLAAAGEQLMLSDGTGNILDSISFGAQSPDISTGRCPNGTGNFGTLPYTSFNSSNCPLSIQIQENFFQPIIYPNPAYNTFNYLLPAIAGNYKIVLFNPVGQIVKVKTVSGSGKMDVIELASGIYFVEIVSGDKVLTRIKIILQK